MRGAGADGPEVIYRPSSCLQEEKGRGSDWAMARLGAGIQTGEGIVRSGQPACTMQRVEQDVRESSQWGLTIRERGRPESCIHWAWDSLWEGSVWWNKWADTARGADAFSWGYCLPTPGTPERVVNTPSQSLSLAWT